MRESEKEREVREGEKERDFSHLGAKTLTSRVRYIFAMQSNCELCVVT